MLEFQNVTIKLNRDGRILVQDLSLVLQKGEKAVLVGEEGNGKSTLLKLIAGKAPWVTMSGKIRLSGPAGYLPQFPDFSGSVADLFADLEPWNYTAILEALEIPYESLFSGQLFSTLSGGEKVRFSLLALLMQNPDVLLLDEPTNDLDIRTLEWFRRFLSLCPQTVLFVSHDETLIEEVHPTILHLEQLKRKSAPRLTVSRLGWTEYLAQRQALFAKQDQVAAGQRQMHEKKMERWRRIHDAVEHQQNTASRQDPMKAASLKRKLASVNAAGRRHEREAERFRSFSESETAILTAFDSDISIPSGKQIVSFDGPLRTGDRTLCQHVSLQITGPGITGITGENGAGKSTLLARIRDLLKDRPDLSVGYIPQNYGEVLDLSLPAVQWLQDFPEARTRLGSMRFTVTETEQPMKMLSGGQQAKVLFLKMVLARNDVLLLDEPTRNFSPLSAPVIREALKAFGGTILLVSHDRKLLEICDRILVLDPAGLKEWKRETDL